MTLCYYKISFGQYLPIKLCPQMWKKSNIGTVYDLYVPDQMYEKVSFIERIVFYVKKCSLSISKERPAFVSRLFCMFSKFKCLYILRILVFFSFIVRYFSLKFFFHLQLQLVDTFCWHFISYGTKNNLEFNTFHFWLYLIITGF